MYVQSNVVKILNRILVEVKKSRTESIPENKLEVANNLMQLGNISIASLVLGQAFGGFTFNYKYALGGLLLWLFLYSSAILFMRKRT